MKTALILTGKFGSTNMSITNIMKNVIIPNNCDVFFYTFDEYYINLFDEISIDNHFKLDDEDINYIKDVIGENLKSFNIEQNDKYDLEYEIMEPLINDKISFMKKDPDDVHSSACNPWFFDTKNNRIKDFKRYVEQYFINTTCFNIVEEYESANNIRYDAIIRLRCDSYFYEPFIMPTVDSNTLVFIGDPFDEWLVTSFFAGSRDSMEIILKNTLDEFFIKPTKSNYSEYLMHEIQFGCAVKQLCIKHNFDLIRSYLMANVIKLTKEGITINMGHYHTNKIIPDDYSKISKYIKDKTIALRCYIFLNSGFWTDCNEETAYKTINKF